MRDSYNIRYRGEVVTVPTQEWAFRMTFADELVDTHGEDVMALAHEQWTRSVERLINCGWSFVGTPKVTREHDLLRSHTVVTFVDRAFVAPGNQTAVDRQVASDCRADRPTWKGLTWTP